MLTHAPQPSRSALLVLGLSDPTLAGPAALALPGVAGVTADPERRQLLVRYDPHEVGAERIRRAVRPDLEAPSGAGTRMLLSAWPTLAKALPAAASLI